MNKIAKIAITSIVFLLIIIYFIIFRGPKKLSSNTYCLDFNKVLSARSEEYFKNYLPASNGEVKVANIQDLIGAGFITIEDLKNIGNICSGNIYITNIENRYYYYNDVKCGDCNIENLYLTWSNWSDYLANITADSHVMTDIYYNYGIEEKKITDWSQWGLDVTKLEVQNLPGEAEVINTESENKKQYSYRDGEFKWYKIEGGTKEYYNNGAYFEKNSSNEYTKEISSKTTSRTKTYLTETELKKDLIGLTYDYSKAKEYQNPTTTRYRYKMQVNECAKTTYTCTYKANETKYKCCANLYTCRATNPSTSMCAYDTEASAIEACKIAAGTGSSTCFATGCGNLKYHYTLTYSGNKSGISYNCTTECELSIEYTNGTCIHQINENATTSVSVENCLKNGFIGGLCTGSNGTIQTPCWNDSNCFKVREANGFTLTSCSNSYTQKYTSYEYSYYAIQSNQTSCSAGTSPIQTSINYNSCTTPTYTNSTSCPSDKPAAVAVTVQEDKTKIVENCGSECTSCTPYGCTSNIQKTVYLTKNGSTTENINNANYFTDEEYANLKVSGWTKDTSAPKYDYAGIYKEGKCSGTPGCLERTIYKATIYKYKWYRILDGTKVWYNNGAYSTKSPGNGWIIDKNSSKWGNWSEFTDNKATSSDTREIKTQTLTRIRKSYIDSKSLMLDEWLPLRDFEYKVGKTLEELKKDTSITVLTKLMFKYRTLK